MLHNNFGDSPWVFTLNLMWAMKNSLCTNLAVAPGVDVDHVVSAMVVAAVHEDGVQDVGRRILLVGVLQVLVQVQPLRELKPVKERRMLVRST